jgi:polyhydroxyalkanoate synthesis regulator protein
MDMMNIATPIKAMEEQTRRNVEMFQNAMRMFTPFPMPGPTGGDRGRRRRPKNPRRSMRSPTICAS